MADEPKRKDQEYQPYQSEEPVDKATRRKEQQEIRDASRHAAQEMASEELGNEKPISREQAEKEMHEAARHVQKEKGQSSS